MSTHLGGSFNCDFIMLHGLISRPFAWFCLKVKFKAMRQSFICCHIFLTLTNVSTRLYFLKSLPPSKNYLSYKYCICVLNYPIFFSNNLHHHHLILLTRIKTPHLKSRHNIILLELHSWDQGFVTTLKCPCAMIAYKHYEYLHVLILNPKSLSPLVK
jgi:hypothetical protein